VSEEEARVAVNARIEKEEKLCEVGLAAKQFGGWSCKAGVDCKKSGFRCNTQYVCEPKSIDLTERLVPSPTPLATVAVSPEKTPLAEAPNPLPNVKPSATPTAAVVEIKRTEVKNGDKTYIEETQITKDGTSVTSVQPKTGKESPLPQPSVAMNAIPTPSATPTEKVALAGASLLKIVGECKPHRWNSGTKENPPVDYEVVGLEGTKCKITRSVKDQGAWVCKFTPELRAKFAILVTSTGDKAFGKFLGDEDVCLMLPP
jgi:hypothetical protein